MITAFVAFCIALAGLAVLFSHKAIEMRRGAPVISQGLRDKGDELVQAKIYDKKDALLAHGKGAISSFILGTRQAVYGFIVRSLHALHDRSARLLERMKGARIDDKSNKGSVSFFLRHVAEYKQEEQRDRDPNATDGF